MIIVIQTAVIVVATVDGIVVRVGADVVIRFHAR